VGSDTIDKLIFALGGDLTALNKAYAEAEAGAQKTGTSIKSNFTSGFKDAAAAATQHRATLKKAMGDVDAAVKNTHGSTATATREFRALFDELSSGRTRQTPGTLAIIATRVFGISGATLAWSVALAAIPVAFAVAALQAENALSRIDDALRRTGNAAGATRSQILAIAQQQNVPGLSERGALDSMGILLGRGNMSASMGASLLPALPGFARQSNLSQDKASEELEKLMADPTKAANQLNEEFKLLDISTTRQIETLQASGEMEGAQAVLAKALNDRFDKLGQSTWSLARAFSSFGTGLATFWFKTDALFSGTQVTDPQKLARMQAMLADDKNAMAGGKSAHGTDFIYSELANLPGEIKALQAKIAADDAGAKSGRARATADSQIGFGLKIADQYDEQATHAKKLQEQLSGLNIALAAATGPNAKYADQIKRERDAVDLALKNQRTPAQIAAEEADDQRKIAAAPEARRNTMRAQLAAQRELERNLANPTTAPYAQSIYSSQMSVAALNNKDIKKEATEAEQQDKRLVKVQAEAAAALALSKAYDQSAAAVARQKAVGEVAAAVQEKTIRADQQEAYAQALLTKEYAAAYDATSKKIASDTIALAGLKNIGTAGGNPLAIALAKAQNKAAAQTAAEFANAQTPDQKAAAAAHYNRALSLETQTNSQNAINSGQSTLLGAQQNLSNIQAQAGVFSPDALRQLHVMQSTMDTLVKSGLGPASDDFKKLYDAMLPVNMKISDLTEKLQQARQAASDFASDVTGPLEQFLEKGGSIRKMLGDVFAGLGKSTIHDFIIKPAQKALESSIGSILGVGLGTPDGSLTNPYYVMMAPQGALLNGASGGLGSILTGTPGGGGLLGSLFGGVGSFVSSLFGGGKASGGYTDPGKFYVVGENGPEILGPGAGGKVTPLSAPKDASSNGGAMQTAPPSEMHFSIQVNGNGDKELLAQMDAVAATATQKGIEQNNKSAKRVMRGTLINQNKRALS
jgi:hypothetical protein